jgi:hypothetical protein
LNGTLSVYHRGHRLAATRLPHGHRPQLPKSPHIAVTVPVGPPNKAHDAPPGHPWKKWMPGYLHAPHSVWDRA